jgi:hypothetical protein
MNKNVKLFRVRHDGDTYQFYDLLEFAEDIAYHKRQYDGDNMPYKWFIETNNGIITRFKMT